MSPDEHVCILAMAIGGDKDAGGEPGHTRTFEVAVSFEEALDRLVPISQPSSSLEARHVMTWPLVGGGRLFCTPGHVAWLEEIR